MYETSRISSTMFLWSLFRLYDAAMPNVVVTRTRIVNIVIHYLLSLEGVVCWRVSNLWRNYIAEICYFLLVRRKFTTQSSWGEVSDEYSGRETFVYIQVHSRPM